MQDEPPTAESGAARIAALGRYAVRDAPPDLFDDLARLAAQLCDTPAGLVTLVDADRQVFMGRFGFEAAEAPLDVGFCPHVVRAGVPLIIPDILAEPDYAANQAAQEGVRFYAGVPLLTAAGLPLGTVCVLDRRPRRFSEAQVAALQALARQAMTLLELRLAVRSQDASDRRRDAIFQSAVDFAIIATDRSGRVTDWNAGAERVLGWQADEMRGHGVDRSFTPEDRAADRVAEEMLRAVRDGRAGDERWYLRRDGSRFWAVSELVPLRDADGAQLGFLRIMRDRTERRRAALALREAQGLNAAILNTSRDCIVVLDLEARTRFVSPGGIAAMEIADVDAIIGLSWLRVWSGVDHERAREAVARAREGGIGRFQGFCPTHKGTPKWWDVMISPLPGPDGRPEQLVSVGRDITDLKQAEQRLSRSEERYRTLAETLPQLVWMCSPDGRCQYLSRQWVEFTGLSEAEQLGLDWMDRVIHPEDRDRLYEHWMGAVEGRHPYDIDFRIRRADGRYRWFKTRGTAILDADGATARWFGTSTDIQEIVEAREVLARSREDLERQIEARTQERDRAWKHSRDLQLVLDAGGTFRAANEAWTDILGWRPEEVVGRSYLDFIHADDQRAGSMGLEADGGGALPSRESRFRRKDEGWRWISWVAAPAAGLIYASGRDVTAERDAQARLAETQEQLRQSQKMEAVGQLTGGIAHDFNNLLTGISGSLELVQRRLTQGRIDDLPRYIEAAQAASRRAAALTHRLLAFARQQPLEPRPTHVARLVAGMEELIRRTVGPGIAVEVTATAGLWPTLVDPNQLENALLNLCINARDAMPGGGRLTIATTNRVATRPATRPGDLPPGDYVALSVCDTGTGMAPEVIARAFDPFFTTKPAGEGTGLGLSMAYGFARQSGGDIRIDSTPGRGTAVTIDLPRHVAVDAGSAADPQEPAARLSGGAGGTMLVVDNEAATRLLAAQVATGLGLRVIEAKDGAAALAVLRSNARIDLLLAHVGLPGGINGRQVADAGRAARPGLRVLLTTGQPIGPSLDSGRLEPGMHLVPKPFAMQTLRERIRDVLGRSPQPAEEA